jgi:serine protease SohB
VAASGGYMMACVADKIVASPFAIMGSIGVVAQIPNFSKLLKKNDIDYEILTAGKYKRTLTMFGENTEQGREKFQTDLEDTHELFKTYVSERRPSVDIESVATGDIWFGSKALEVSLVDELKTSDEYIIDACANADVFSVAFKDKKSLMDKVGIAVSTGIESSVTKILSELNVTRSFK